MSEKICIKSDCAELIKSRHKKAKFCSRSCAASVNNRLKPKREKQSPLKKNCHHCDNIIDSQDKNIKNQKFCNLECFHKAKRANTIKNWLNGTLEPRRIGGQDDSIRQYLLDECNHACSKCGWNDIHPTLGYPPLEVDHIDGNWKNISKENLRVLCPNCHALQPTYRRLNEGNNEMVGDIYYYRRKEGKNLRAD